MSMILCEGCDHLIDSDDDPGCFIEAPDYLPLSPTQRRAMEQVLCEGCRENQYDREQERLHGGCQP